MKKNLLYSIVLFAIPLTTLVLFSYSNGAPTTGATGSPGDGGVSCTSCHNITDNYGATVTITSNIPSSGFELGKTYQITVTETANSNAAKFGFQITAEDESNAKIGSFAITDAINTKVDTNNHFVTQTTAGTSQKSWSFNWTAPTTFTSNLTFYAAALSANVTGDIKSQTVLISDNIGGVLAIKNVQFIDFNMYPNPTDGIVNVQLPSDINEAKVDIFDYLGRQIMQKHITTSDHIINVSNLSTGIYFVRIKSNLKTGTRKLVVK